MHQPPLAMWLVCVRLYRLPLQPLGRREWFVVISAYTFSTLVSGLAFWACLALLGLGLAACLGGAFVVLAVLLYSATPPLPHIVTQRDCEL